MCLPVRNGLVNKVKFLGLFLKSVKDQWDCEIGNYYIALPYNSKNLSLLEYLYLY